MDLKRNIKDFEEALQGLDFPTSRAAIVNKVKDRGGIDGHVVEVAEQLPGRTYDWERDAVREFERLLVEHEPLDDDKVAAAPSDLSGREKAVVENLADPRRGER